MANMLNASEFAFIKSGFNKNPSRSLSLRKEAYIKQSWFDVDLEAVIKRTWQWACHVEKLSAPGSYMTIDIAGQPIAIVRDKDGELRAFYNVCQHRAHELLKGEGKISKILCPYHAWSYNLSGALVRAPHTEKLEEFKIQKICLI